MDTDVNRSKDYDFYFLLDHAMIKRIKRIKKILVHKTNDYVIKDYNKRAKNMLDKQWLPDTIANRLYYVWTPPHKASIIKQLKQYGKYDSRRYVCYDSQTSWLIGSIREAC